MSAIFEFTQANGRKAAVPTHTIHAIYESKRGNCKLETQDCIWYSDETYEAVLARYKQACEYTPPTSFTVPFPGNPFNPFVSPENLCTKEDSRSISLHDKFAILNETTQPPPDLDGKFAPLKETSHDDPAM